MKTLSWILGLLVTLFSASLTEVHAADQFLFSVGGQVTSKWTNVSLRLDDRSGEAIGLVVDNDYYSAAEVKAGAKIRIDGVDNSRDVLKIHAPMLSTVKGGRLTLVYLHDGIQNTYRQFDLELKRDGDTWKAFVPGQSKAIASLYMTKNTFFGKLIGIDGIKASFAMLDVVVRRSADEVA